MSSIVPMGLVVSGRSCARVEVRGKLAENCPRCAPFAVDWRRLKARHSERAGYVIGDRQGQLELPRNVTRDPGVFHAAGRIPLPRGGERSDPPPETARHHLVLTWLHLVPLGSTRFHLVPARSAPLRRGAPPRRPGTR